MPDYAPPILNRTVLMSGADYFDVIELNPFSRGHGRIDRDRAQADFARLESAFKEAGITVKRTPAPPDCQDAVFTANWAVCRGDTAVLSSLPSQRAAEQPAAEAALQDLGLRTVKSPVHFSGQGDALPCGDRLFCGSGYRTDPAVHQLLGKELGYEVISVQTVPARDEHGRPLTNRLTGLPDSYFYDLDLAICILRSDLIGWCPEAFTPESQATIRAISDIHKIEIDRDEAVHGFACNSVSTGSVVITGPHAPRFKAAIEAHGLATITVDAPELAKGGGGIRCSSLTLDND